MSTKAAPLQLRDLKALRSAVGYEIVYTAMTAHSLKEYRRLIRVLNAAITIANKAKDQPTPPQAAR